MAYYNNNDPMGHRGKGLVESCKISLLPLRSRYIRRRLDAILLFSPSWCNTSISNSSQISANFLLNNCARTYTNKKTLKKWFFIDKTVG
uniref:Uncharacterized protein n=1 Tax=Oryza meridionalis TaxID=40149 RepID=A0A0E0DGV6_9ORYZ